MLIARERGGRGGCFEERASLLAPPRARRWLPCRALWHAAGQALDRVLVARGCFAGAGGLRASALSFLPCAGHACRFWPLGACMCLVGECQCDAVGPPSVSAALSRLTCCENWHNSIPSPAHGVTHKGDATQAAHAHVWHATLHSAPSTPQHSAGAWRTGERAG